MLKLLCRYCRSYRFGLLHIFPCVARSRIDYGILVYGSGRASTLNMLNPLHYLGLHLATGALRAPAILTLYSETKAWSLESRRMFISVMYVLRVRSLCDHLLFEPIMAEQYEITFGQKFSIVP